jgi:hypothetical protein
LRDSAGFSPVFTQGFAMDLLELSVQRRKGNVKELILHNQGIFRGYRMIFNVGKKSFLA